jgi:hypothetical protein
VISLDDIVDRAINLIGQQTSSTNCVSYKENLSLAQQSFYRLSAQQVARAFFNVLIHHTDNHKGDYSDISG